jgi:putative FmdB family regulatory protein
VQLSQKEIAMPLYEYECKKCKKHTEKIQKFSDPEITKCPRCGGPLERVVSAAAISFKGGGWFKDGYSHAKPKSSSESESKTKSDSGASPTEASASSGKDAKPAAAPGAPAAPATAPAASSSDKK